MKFAIIGLGFISPRHFEAIRNIGGEVVATCDNNPAKNADYLSYKDMISQADFDTGVICTPNYLHAEMVRSLLIAGKKVLCEKPLTIDTDFELLNGVNVVHQLRYHPKMYLIKSLLKEQNEIKAVFKAYRDQNYWNSWKGDETKSGGPLYVIGAHTIDLLIYLLGNEYEILEAQNLPKLASGKIRFGKSMVDYHIEFLDSREGQGRSLTINGVEVELSIQDNLSFEGLHTRVYENMLIGNGIGLEEASKSLILIDKLKKWQKSHL